MANGSSNDAIQVLGSDTEMKISDTQKPANCSQACEDACTDSGQGECRRVQCTTRSEIRYCAAEGADRREEREYVPVEIVRMVTMRLCAADKQRHSLEQRIIALKKSKDKIDRGKTNDKVSGVMYIYDRLLIKIELGEELLRHNEVNIEGLRDTVNRKYGTHISQMFFEQVCEDFRAELMAKKLKSKKEPR